MKPLVLAVSHRIAALLLLTVVSSPGLAGENRQYFTAEQSKAGASVYASQCSVCHGSQLQGKTGPALAGTDFHSSIEYSKMSGKQLYQFISSQMPYNKPGSLTDTQYQQIVAYILDKNGFPAGKQLLTEKSLDQVSLLPFPE